MGQAPDRSSPSNGGDMTTQDFTSQEPPMPRDYNPGGSDAKVTRTIDSHDPTGQDADERRNSHDL